MCYHKWVSYKFEPQPLVCVNGGWMSTVNPASFVVTKVKCVECGEIQDIAESPSVAAQREIDDYMKYSKKETK